MKIERLSFEPDALGTLINLQIRVQEGVDLRGIFASVLNLPVEGIAPAAKPLSLGSPEATAQEADAIPTTRRRRSATSADAGATASDAGAKTEPSTIPDATGTSRRRRSTQTAETAAPSAEQSSTDGNTGARRRRSVSTTIAEPPLTTTSPSELTDSDLSKAASGAARTLTPKGVTAIVQKYNAEFVNQIKAEDRQAFLTELKAAVEKATA